MNDIKEHAATIALGMYIGEICKYCGCVFSSIQDIRDKQVVWAANKHMKIAKLGQSLACKTCYENNKDKG